MNFIIFILAATLIPSELGLNLLEIELMTKDVSTRQILNAIDKLRNIFWLQKIPQKQILSLTIQDQIFL